VLSNPVGSGFLAGATIICSGGLTILRESLVVSVKSVGALQILEDSSYEPNLHSDKNMARAVGRRSNKNQAMVDFDSAGVAPAGMGERELGEGSLLALVPQAIQAIQAERVVQKRKSHST